MKLWLDGQVTTLEESGISPLSYTLHYGGGAFEGIRAYQTEDGRTHIFRLREHLERLFYSAGKMYATIPWNIDDLSQACQDVVRANHLDEAYIRPLVFFDDSNLGLDPQGNRVRVLIAAWPWGAYLSASSVAVQLSSIRRISEQSTVADAKICGHYVNSIMATTEAKRSGYEEALLLDHEGKLAEGPGENIFLITGQELHTPHLGKILSGITRDAVITFAGDLGYQVVERSISPRELGDFEEAFFTGTAAEVTPIKAIDDPHKSPLARYETVQATQFKDYYQDILRGRNPRYTSWLSFLS